MRKSTVIVLIIIVIVIAGGLGAYFATRSSDNKTPTTGNMSGMNMSTKSNNTNSAPVLTSAVTIQNFAFSPASITVKKGATVTWTNKDSTSHTVTQDDNQPAGSPGLDSKVLAQGESYSATFNTVGTFHYHCSIHPNMTGTVTVTE